MVKESRELIARLPGGFLNWLRGGQGSTEPSVPIINSIENTSSESGNIASVDSENPDSEVVTLGVYYFGERL